MSHTITCYTFSCYSSN